MSRAALRSTYKLMGERMDDLQRCSGRVALARAYLSATM